MFFDLLNVEYLGWLKLVGIQGDQIIPDIVINQTEKIALRLKWWILRPQVGSVHAVRVHSVSHRRVAVLSRQSTCNSELTCGYLDYRSVQGTDAKYKNHCEMHSCTHISLLLHLPKVFYLIPLAGIVEPAQPVSQELFREAETKADTAILA